MKKKERRADGWLFVWGCANLHVHICVCVCVHMRSSLWRAVEGVLICHLALQVKPENSGRLRGRGINNTKVCKRKETERETDIGCRR